MELRFFSFSLSFPAGRLGADPDAQLKSKLFDKGGGGAILKFNEVFYDKNLLEKHSNLTASTWLRTPTLSTPPLL